MKIIVMPPLEASTYEMEEEKLKTYIRETLPETEYFSSRDWGVLFQKSKNSFFRSLILGAIIIKEELDIGESPLRIFIGPQLITDADLIIYIKEETKAGYDFLINVLVFDGTLAKDEVIVKDAGEAISEIIKRTRASSK